MTVIVDYGMGNPASIRNMFRRIEAEALISSDPDVIQEAKKILLPGVGSFDAAMNTINGSNLRRVLDHKATVERVPLLGICLGAQLLTRGSEEGALPGLGWIPADTKHFSALEGLKVPHMGWNIALPHGNSVLTRDLPTEPRFYFVHSYYISVDDPTRSIMQTTHGVTFDSAIQRDNIYGVQFHPEKSHKFGMKLLENFAKL